MAKQKRSAADLDAELAALEAEIAALEGKPRPTKPKAPSPPEAKPAEPAASAPADPAPPAPAEKKAGRFALPKFGKKKATPEPEPAAAPSSSPASSPQPRAQSLPPPPPSYDLSVWREEDGAWVRSVPETPVAVVRRVLDEDGNVVREEPATTRDVESVTGVKAERGIGRLLRRK